MPPYFKPETERKIVFWLGITAGLFIFIYLIRSILLPFVVGILVAYFLDPAADRLEAKGLSRGAATSVITIAFFSAIILVIVLLAPTLVEQISGFIGQLPDYYDNIRRFARTYLNKLPFDLNGAADEQLKELNSELFGGVQGFFMGLLQSGLVIVNLVSLLVITPVVAFYLLRDWDYLTSKVDGLLPRQHAPVIREQLAEIDKILAGFIRGQFNVMLIFGAYHAIALSLVGLPFGVLIGLLTGLLIIVPYIGAFMGTALALGIAFAQFDDMTRIAAVGGIFLFGQLLESYYLTPKLVGGKVGLHPVWVIFGMLAGGTLFGFVGILLAVPITAVIGVLVRFAVHKYLASDLYEAH